MQLIGTTSRVDARRRWRVGFSTLTATCVVVILLAGCRTTPKQRLTAGDQAFVTELRPVDPTQVVDQPPRVVRSVAIAYPGVRLQEREEGRATVEFTIAKDGKIRDIDIVESTSPPFSGYLLMRLPQWRFVPAQRDGQPVDVRYRQRFNFSLDAGSETRENRYRGRLEREDGGPRVVETD